MIKYYPNNNKTFSIQTQRTIFYYNSNLREYFQNNCSVQYIIKYLNHSYYFIECFQFMSIKDRIAMFQKLTGNPTTASSSTSPILNFQKPPATTPPTTFQQKPPNTPPQNVPSNNNKTGGTVQSPTIVKPSVARQSQSYNTQNISNNISNNLVSSTFTPSVNLPPVLLVKESSDKVVKVTENSLVDKASLPGTNAMKEMIEGRMKQPQQNIWKKKVQVPKEQNTQNNSNPWLKNNGQTNNQNNPPTQTTSPKKPSIQECPPWRRNNDEHKAVEPEHTEVPKNNQPAWIKNTGQHVIQNQVPTWTRSNNVIVESNNSEGPRETPQIQTNVHIGVKENARLISQLFQNQLTNQKKKAEEEQALRNREKEHQNTVNEELASIKNQERQFVPEYGNSQNIAGGDMFSRPIESTPAAENNTMNVAVQEAVSQQTGVESGMNSLAARLIKRKQMRKANFSSDDD